MKLYVDIDFSYGYNSIRILNKGDGTYEFYTQNSYSELSYKAL